MIKLHKILGGTKFAPYFDKQLTNLARVVINTFPLAYLNNKGFNLKDRFDDVPSPVVTVSNVNVAQATISWPEIDEALMYRIERGQGSDFTNSTSIITSDTAYTLTGLTGGSVNYVRVSALNRYVEGVSDPVIIRTKVSAPSGISTTNVTATSFRVNFAGVAGVTYVVEVSTQANFSGATTFNVTGVDGANNYNVTGRTAATQYYYRVKGTKSGHPDSNYASGTVTTAAA